MKKVLLFTVLALVLGSCVDNEISFFVEHAKKQPEAPSCTWSPSDDFAASGTLDLAFSGIYNQGFLVQNQLMIREDYDNLKAETNGIFIEGYEVSVRLSSNEAVGGTETADIEFYVEPESVGVVPVTVLSRTTVDALAEGVNCLRLSRANYPADSVYPGYTDVNGEPIPREAGFAYINVRFFGRTNGGLDVETPEFTFGISLCCGCLVNWSNCSVRCERYCEEPEEDKMCNNGVGNGDSQYDCRWLYEDPDATWDDPADPNCVDEADDGSETRRNCTCADCGA